MRGPANDPPLITTETGQLAVVLKSSTEFGRVGVHLLNSWPERRVIAVRHTLWAERWASPDYRKSVRGKLKAGLYTKAALEGLALLAIMPMIAMPNVGPMANEEARFTLRGVTLPPGVESFTVERKGLTVPMLTLD